jgi:magnesium-transporting ATPase (P-type)
MLADSKVLSGQGKALVLAVGASTYAARNRSKSQLVLSEQQT